VTAGEDHGYGRSRDLRDFALFMEERGLEFQGQIKLGGSSPRAVETVRPWVLAEAVARGFSPVLQKDWIMAIRDFGELRVVLQAARWDTSVRPPRDLAVGLIDGLEVD
jgi:hypothetical protein